MGGVGLAFTREGDVISKGPLPHDRLNSCPPNLRNLRAQQFTFGDKPPAGGQIHVELQLLPAAKPSAVVAGGLTGSASSTSVAAV